MTTKLSKHDEAVRIAIRFHEAYERLAPSFYYETRTDTREFDPESKNGRLMVAVCQEVAVPDFVMADWALVLREALGALGVIGNSYCFCSTNRDPDKQQHEPECRDARAALSQEPK